MTDDFITVTRTLVKRGWTDIEPKIAVGFASGTFAAIALQITNAYGVTLPPSIVPYIPYLFAMIGGYIAPSAGTTVMKTETLPTGVMKQETETHSGNSVSVVTSPTLVQHTPNRFDNILNQLPSNSNEIPSYTADNRATEIFEDRP